MTATSYKNQRSPRNLIEQISFNLGVVYSYQELPEQTARAIVNYNLIDRGGSLTPRKGLKATIATFNGVAPQTVQRGTGNVHTTQSAVCKIYEHGQTKTEVTPLGVGLGKPFGNVFMNILKGGE